MVKNMTHSKISDNHIIIIQYSLLILFLISSFIAFTPFIIAKFVTNVCIFSPLNMSLITINTINTEITAITNIKILNAKWSKMEVSMKMSPSLSKVLCCLSKLNFLWKFWNNSLEHFLFWDRKGNFPPVGCKPNASHLLDKCPNC